MTIITPIVHLNGTPKDMLLEQRETAYSAIHAALDAMREMAPNGRDYYPEAGRMEKAQEQHARRGAVLKQLLEEIETECRMIEDSAP